MLSPRKLKNFDEIKVVPTINIFYPLVLKGWNLIRKVCQDYGKTFFLRIQCLYGFIFVLCLIEMIVLLLNIANLIYIDHAF